ncbi:MAG: hypothetical protein K2X47_05505 [Bdellovibrionales bacterium]|nr:hypothetical protein [Bdellovibrionales bacterium]
MVSTGALLLIVGLNGFGNGNHVLPPPQTHLDIQSFNYLAGQVDSYETYLKMIPTQMNSTGEGNQVQREFLSHALGQMQNLVRNEIESLPVVRKVREMPNAWLKSAGKAIASERIAASEAIVLEPLANQDAEAEVAASEATPQPTIVSEEKSIDHQFRMDINPTVAQARMKYSGYLDANLSYLGIAHELELGFSKTFGSTKLSFDHLVQIDTKSMLKLSWAW